MDREEFIELLEAHRESYDYDRGVHYGCVCKGTSIAENSIEGVFENEAWYREHLADHMIRKGVIEP